MVRIFLEPWSTIFSIQDHVNRMSCSELNTVFTVGLSGAASLYSVADMTFLNNLSLSRKNFTSHFELSAVMSVISAVAVSKLIWPEGIRSKNESDFGTIGTRKCAEQSNQEPMNGLGFAIR